MKNKNNVIKLFNNMNLYIAIGGYKQAGKDTLGSYYCDKHGVKKISFGDNLKNLCAFVFDIPTNDFHDQIKKEKKFDVKISINENHIERMNNFISLTHSFSVEKKHYIGTELTSIREMLQFVGTEIIRKTYNNYHTEVTGVNIKSFPRAGAFDVRFPNELECVRQVAKEKDGAFLSIWVHRNGKNGDGHESERSMSPEMFDYEIYNNGTFEELYSEAEIVLENCIATHLIEMIAKQ